MNSNIMGEPSVEIFLRRITDADLQKVFEGLSNPAVTKYYGIVTRNLHEAIQQMQWYARHEANKTGNFWVIASVEDKEFCGVIGIYDVDVHFKAEIGIWLLPKYWGKGIAQEAINWVCNFGFSQLNLHRIQAFVETENHATKRLMERTGFRLEGCMKDSEIKNNAFVSLNIYARLNE
jgi:[ribosomal protein S5]-alanine N-acetyltransferase